MPVYTPEQIDFNTKCPDFNLKTIYSPYEKSKTELGKKDFLNGKPFLVLFICNHCPYVKAIEDRLITLGSDLQKLDINMIAICSNDAESYPEDSYAELVKQAELKKYSFTYLHDENQLAAKAFGAICTPDYFLYDSNAILAYRGRLDDSWKNPELVTQRELYNATVELLNTKSITSKQTPSMGCSIKWIK